MSCAGSMGSVVDVNIILSIQLLGTVHSSGKTSDYLEQIVIFKNNCDVFHWNRIVRVRVSFQISELSDATSEYTC